MIKLLITGHRRQKLTTYDTGWIPTALYTTLENLKLMDRVLGFSGMASGVDLWFCEACIHLDIPYIACIPFEGQEDTMSSEDARDRDRFVRHAKEVKHVKNSWMVEHCNMGLVVWDGNKGGTHNVVQQLIENKKDFIWINPVSKVVWKCFK